MSMFTSIIHPVDGTELQIKTGHDSCETYRVGDEVNWHVDPELPGWGTLLDGVYDSCSEKGEGELVVIIDHKVAGVMPDSDPRRRQIEEDLEIKNRKFWPEEKWAKKEIEDKEREIERITEDIKFLKTLAGKTDEEIYDLRHKHFMECMTAPLKQVIGYEGLVRRIFAPRKVK